MESNGIELYARRCTCTGKGINSGYVIGEYYAIDERCADMLARHSGHKSYKQMYDLSVEALGKNQTMCYYTEWEPEDEETILYDIMGNEYYNYDEEGWKFANKLIKNPNSSMVPHPISFESETFEIGKIYLEKDIKEFAKINDVKVHYMHHSLNPSAQIGKLALYISLPENIDLWFIFRDYFSGDRCYKCVYFEN